LASLRPDRTGTQKFHKTDVDQKLHGRLDRFFHM